MFVGDLKILLDENVPVSIKEGLRRKGYDDVITIGESYSGISDDEVIELATKEGRLLITQDNDFKKLKSKNRFGVLQFSSNIDDVSEAIDFGIKKALSLKNSVDGMFIRMSNKNCYLEYPKKKYNSTDFLKKSFELKK